MDVGRGQPRAGVQGADRPIRDDDLVEERQPPRASFTLVDTFEEGLEWLGRALDVISSFFAPREADRLRDGLADRAFEPMSPRAIEPPQDAIDRLRSAKSVLIVTHVPPDADAIGSALGLARALRALGKKVDVCMDDIVPSDLKKLDPDQELKRAHRIRRQKYDLAVVLDVADAKRIGRADELIKRAPRALVVDHHNVEPDHERLGLSKRKKITKWVDSDADATSVLISSLIYHLAEGKEIDWPQVTFPLLAGIFMDTGGFKHPGAKDVSLRVFKHLLETHHEGKLEPLLHALEYELPGAAQALLSGTMDVELPEEAAALEKRLDALKERGVSLETKEAGPVAYFCCPKELLSLTCDVARSQDPGANIYDIRGYLMRRLDKLAEDHEIAALLFQSDDGVQVSARSAEPGPALALAKHFGGGGHERKAAAQPELALPDLEKEVCRWAEDWPKLRAEVNLRALGGPS